MSHVDTNHRELSDDDFLQRALKTATQHTDFAAGIIGNIATLETEFYLQDLNWFTNKIRSLFRFWSFTK